MLWRIGPFVRQALCPQPANAPRCPEQTNHPLPTTPSTSNGPVCPRHGPKKRQNRSAGFARRHFQGGELRVLSITDVGNVLWEGDHKVYFRGDCTSGAFALCKLQ